MKKITIGFIILFSLGAISFAQKTKQLVPFEQLFPKPLQREMGLHKLTTREKEKLHRHVEQLLLNAISSSRSSGKIYANIGSEHWIKKNIDNGTYIILEDNSFWQVDHLDRINALLWLPLSNISVEESSDGLPGYDYLLINTDDGELVHAKYMGKSP